MAITSKDKPNIERLKELKTLYEAGILTKEEMEAEKAEIFGTNKNDTQQPSTVEVKHKSKNEDKGITVLHDKTTKQPNAISKFFHSKTSIVVIGLLVVIITIASFACIKSCGEQQTENYIAVSDTTVCDTVVVDTISYEPAEEIPTKFEHIARKRGNFKALIEWPVSMTGIADVNELQKSIINKVFDCDCNDINDCIEQYLNDGEESASGTEYNVKGFISLKYLQRQNDIYMFNEQIFADYGGAGAAVIYGETYINFDKELGRDLTIDDLTNDYSALLNIVNRHISLNEYESKADKLPENFIITPTGITFIFPRYSIGYGTQGQPYISVSYNELKDVLPERFKRAIGNIPFKEKWEKCKLTGTMANDSISYSIKLTFERRGHDLRNIYMKINNGERIEMKGGLLDCNWYFECKDSERYFSFEVDVYDLKGTASNGAAQYNVSLK